MVIRGQGTEFHKSLTSYFASTLTWQDVLALVLDYKLFRQFACLKKFFETMYYNVLVHNKVIVFLGHVN